MAYKKILVGVNFTDACKEALIQAKKVADHNNAFLEVMHVFPTVELNRYVSYYYFDVQPLLRKAQENLEKFVTEAIGATKDIKLSVTEATPHYFLPKYAETHYADLLILGVDHATTEVNDRADFTLRCVRNSNVPTLIVQKSAPLEMAKITACTDFSEAVTPILQNISKITMSQKEQAHVEILHASSPPWLRKRLLGYLHHKYDSEEERKQYAELIQMQLTHTQKEAQKMIPNTAISTHSMETPDSTIGLLDYIRESNSDLVVLGRAGHGLLGLKTNILGSTTDYLIRHSPKSLLIIPTL